MWDFVSASLGTVTVRELVLVGLIFVCVLAYGWAPKVGEAVGAMFDRDED